jgi:hypothetical protein
MKEISKKINHLLLDLPKGVVVTSSWLISKGVNYRLQHHHSHSDTALLESIGTGAYVVRGQAGNVKIEGALHALQSQLNSDFHIGALTSLGEVHNIRHFVAVSDEKLQIFARKNLHIPMWFKKKFGNGCEVYRTQFLPTTVGIESVNFRGFDLRVSSVERAVLEAIFLSGNTNISLKEIAQIMEAATNLRPVILRQLLETCSSVRVKRIFLYLAELQKHAWFNFLDLDKIDLGSGKRVISASCRLNKKYSIVIDDLSEI